MDRLDIFMLIVFMIGPLLSKSLKDKKKINKERLKKAETLTNKPQNVEYYNTKNSLEMEMSYENQSSYQSETYEDKSVDSDFVNVNKHEINEAINIDDGIEQGQYNLKTEHNMKDTSNSILQFTKNDIVKGIIMSEILDKPKSLTKYK